MKSVPINYVPTYITLKIKTTDNKLSETVTIIHYPTPYVEAFQNNGGNDYGGVPRLCPEDGTLISAKIITMSLVLRRSPLVSL